MIESVKGSDELTNYFNFFEAFLKNSGKTYENEVYKNI